MIDSIASTTGLDPSIILLTVGIIVVLLVISAIRRLVGLLRWLAIAAIVGIPSLGIAGSDVIEFLKSFINM